jgi:5-methylcytosine-specific restriction protein A
MSLARTFADERSSDRWVLQKGPGGRNLCRWCKTEVSGRRVTFCSDECVHEWKIRSDPGYARNAVLKRDRGICCKCGRDCVNLRKLLGQKLNSKSMGWLRILRRLRLVTAPQYIVQLIDRGKDITEYLPHTVIKIRNLWEADHIVPVIKGGGLCGLENLRTLCRSCHKVETKNLAKERAAERRAAQSKQQPLDET